MDVARLNFSHGSHEEHLDNINKIRAANQELGTEIAIMLDTKGPEIRTHDFENGKVTLKKGNKVALPCMKYWERRKVRLPIRSSTDVKSVISFCR